MSFLSSLFGHDRTYKLPPIEPTFKIEIKTVTSTVPGGAPETKLSPFVQGLVKSLSDKSQLGEWTRIDGSQSTRILIHTKTGLRIHYCLNSQPLASEPDERHFLWCGSYTFAPAAKGAVISAIRAHEEIEEQVVFAPIRNHFEQIAAAP